MTIKPKVNELADDESPGRTRGDEVPMSNGADVHIAQLVHRDGIAFVEGCDVAVWRLEMNRRAGSSAAAQLKVAPGLTPEGLDLAFAYAEQHPEEMDAPIRELGLDDVPLGEEEDDEAEIQADLDEIFEKYGEVFRRLAQ